ncbi:MAG: DNA repair protein RadA [Deltaproteobacteria bacterium]|nr:MAG: DNA repair protein RadA [Deltaproteobacteria bacterium]
MKAALQHVCRECGYRTAKWFGKCPGCSAFASVFEEAARPPLRAVVPIDQVPLEAGHRDRTGIGELDRALGGGLVPGAVVLLAGDPGIGKSTLLLSALHRLSQLGQVLYVSGEESLQQIRLRGERLGTLSPALYLAAETDAEAALEHARKLRPRILAVDSIQTLALRNLDSACGSVTQVREVGHRLAAYAKETGTPVIIVGHVTKEGSIAGPRVLEHLVDAVLFFEGDRSHAYRVLRAHKNRFGSTNEIGVFEMKSEGLVEVPNPSALFLAERPRDAAGSAVVATMSGTRPLLVEVQALVADSSSGGSPRRTAIGVDGARVALLTAVLERKEGLVLADKDIYVSVAGGAALPEPAGDLAIAAALASSLRDECISAGTLVVGEIGLAGEIRAVGQIEQRLAEGAQLGFTRCVLPQTNRMRTRDAPLELCGVSSVGEAMTALFQ